LTRPFRTAGVSACVNGCCIRAPILRPSSRASRLCVNLSP
jgi:hypothetical protein